MAQGASEDLADAPRGEGSPRSRRGLSAASWRLVYRRTIHGFIAHGLADMAGSLTYFGAIAIAPSIVALMSLSTMFGQGKESVSALLSTIDDVAPGSAISLLKQPLEQFSSSPTIGFAFVASTLISIWATSSYVAAFGRSLNRIYEITEGRPIWKLKPQQILVALAVAALVLITLAALVLSAPVTTGVGDALHIGSTPLTVWSVVKWPLLVLAVVLTVAILYYATPNVEQPKFRWMSEGAFVSVIVVVGVSLLFGTYVKDFAHYDRTYRSFAGIVFVLLWLWISNLTLLFGAEVDAQFERAKQLEAGVAAERQIQLPRRDTEASDRAARNRSEDVREGRSIRRSSEHHRPPRGRKKR
ncbi:MAG: ribonuclease [Microbacteriaceae bacterium]|nr:ribonuclease [Microbacteriaceae bacterium]